MILRKKLITAYLFILFTNLFFANLSNAEENAANLYLKAQSLLSELPKDFMQRAQKVIKSAAIKLYELEKGKTLDNLQEFVPEYLLKLPDDPFDNFKPLKYVKKDKGWVVYSFGPDKQDDHGSIVYNEEETKDSKGDIVFQSF